MAKQLLFRGGNTAEHNTFTGGNKEITVDTQKKTLVVHDGVTAGGSPLAKESSLNDHINSTGNVHEIEFSEINNKPSTLAGYGITDADTKDEVLLKINNAVSTAVSDLVDSSPELLNTLDELASAIGDDPNFATTVANSIAAKVTKNDDIAAGTYNSVTVDSKGLVTSGSNVPNYVIGDIKYTTGDVDASWLVADDRIYSEVDYPELSLAIGKKEVQKYFSFDLTTNTSFDSVVYAYSKYFAAISGYLFVSSDGLAWTLRTSNVANKIIFANGIIVCVRTSSSDTSYVSTDGVNFTSHSFTASGIMNSLTYENGLFIIGTNQREVITSPDGKTWTLMSTIPGSTESLTSISYGSGLYVACMSNGKLYTSADLSSWTLRTSQFGTSQILSSVYANGIFVICGVNGKIATSTNGITWTSRSSGLNSILIRVFYRNNRFEIYKTFSDRCIKSSDGVTWTAGDILLPNSKITVLSILDTNDTAIFTGQDNLNLAVYNTVKKVSNINHDAEKYWKTSTISGSGTNSSIAYAPKFTGKYIVTNTTNGFLLSNDLLNWETVSGVAAFGTAGASKIVYGEGIFVASSGNKIATSTNGTAWTSRTYPSTYHIYNLSYHNGTFIATGNVHAATSPDGITWTLISNFTGANGYSAAGNGMPTIIVGSSGKISISNDFHATWSTPSSAAVLASGIGSSNIKAICAAFINGSSTFLIANRSKMAKSIDNGVTWTEIPNPGFEVNNIIYNEGKFIAVGDSGRIAYSVDLIAWEVVKTNSTYNYRGCCVGPGRIVTVAQNTIATCNTFGVESPEFVVPSLTTEHITAYIKGE